MQEELNQQIKRSQNKRSSSANSQSSTSSPTGTTVNRWAEVTPDPEGLGQLYRKPIKSSQHRIEYFDPGTRAFVLEKQGNWSKVKMEDGVIGWFYNAEFEWLN